MYDYEELEELKEELKDTDLEYFYNYTKIQLMKLLEKNVYMLHEIRMILIKNEAEKFVEHYDYLYLMGKSTEKIDAAFHVNLVMEEFEQDFRKTFKKTF